MTETPIFEALRAEMTCAPLCQVCGKPDLMLSEQEHWLLCWECWMRGYGYAEQRKQLTCAVCGKFPLVWQDHYVRPLPKADADGWTAEFLCREHFDQRQAASAA